VDGWDLPSAGRSISINGHRLTNIADLFRVKRGLQTYLGVPLSWLALGASSVTPV